VATLQLPSCFSIHHFSYSLYILDLSSSVHRHAEKAIFDDSRSLLETEQAYTQQCLNKARGNRLRHLKPGQSQSPPLPRSSSRLYRRQHLHAAHKRHSQRHAISSDDRARQTIRGHGKDRQQGRIEDRQLLTPATEAHTLSGLESSPHSRLNLPFIPNRLCIKAAYLSPYLPWSLRVNANPRLLAPRETPCQSSMLEKDPRAIVG